MEEAIQKEYKDLDYNLALLPYFAELVVTPTQSRKAYRNFVFRRLNKFRHSWRLIKNTAIWKGFCAPSRKRRGR